MSGDHSSEEGYVVRARGLPWSATEEDVMKFFGKCDGAGWRFGSSGSAQVTYDLLALYDNVT